MKEHERCLYYQSAMEEADQTRRMVEQPHTSIAAQVDASKAANIQRNRAVLKSIARAVLFCGRHCLALRDVEKLPKNDTSASGNPGIFLALLKFMMTSCVVIYKLPQCNARHTYLHKRRMS